MKNTRLAKLAIDGGPKVRKTPFPARGHVGREEKVAVDALFDRAIATGQAIGYGGAEEMAYGREFAKFMGGGYADPVNSGTTALYVALRALNLEPFTEVIVGPITDPGGMMPVVMMNCIPVVPDAEPGCYNTGPRQIERLISRRTSAIVLAHIAGEPADIKGVLAVARKRNIPVVEDCAQAHGARLDGCRLGSFGAVSAFSTMFGKHHCTGGQGGVVFTKSEKLYWEVRRAADRGKPFNLPAGSTNCVASLNYNLDEIGCAIGRQQLKKLPGIARRRLAVARKIAAGLAGSRVLSVPPALPGAEPSYWFLRVQVDTDKLACDKAAFCAALGAEGLPVAASYRHLPHTMDWYRNRRVFGTSGLPWTSPLYRGDPDREFPCPNAIAATDVQFNIGIHEAWGPREIKDALAILKKVETAYLKE